jgi:HOOK protein coiled-coil region
MQAKEEKYQRCIEKAKSVIITLDPKQDPNAEVAELRNQIQEKERIIVNMEVIIIFFLYQMSKKHLHHHNFLRVLNILTIFSKS